MSDNLREWTVAEMAADAGAPEGRIRDIIRRLEITPRRKLGRQQCYSARAAARVMLECAKTAAKAEAKQEE
jgi:hypothetical protein